MKKIHRLVLLIGHDPRLEKFGNAAPETFGHGPRAYISEIEQEGGEVIALAFTPSPAMMRGGLDSDSTVGPICYRPLGPERCPILVA